MVAIRLTTFAGTVPRMSERNLPEQNATVARNVRPRADALEPLPRPARVVPTAALAQAGFIQSDMAQSDATPIQNIDPATTRLFRIPTGSDVFDTAASFFLQFTDPDTDVIRTPVVNDAFERYYWCSPSHGLKYNSKARILTGDPEYDVGVEAPGAAPVVAASGGSSATNVTRSYLVTFVTTFGEEGPPSPPREVVGRIDDTFAVSSIPQPTPVSGRSPITQIRIYRTITAASGATTFFRVGQVAVGTTTFNDNQTDTVISANPQIESISWEAPPDMDGIALMPGGIMVGFKGSELYFSETFRPHAWPPQYRLSVQYPIVGLGVFGNTCVVCTQGFPAAVIGSRPEQMTLVTNTAPAACVARGSIVSTPAGVVFATENGLALFGPGGLQEITSALFDRFAWQRDYAPRTLRAIQYDGRYLAFRTVGGVTDAFMFDPVRAAEGVFHLSPLQIANSNAPSVDIWTGRPVVVAERSVFQLMPIEGDPATFHWRSKEIQIPNPLNFGAADVFFDPAPGAHVRLRVWANRQLVFDEDIAPRGPGRDIKLPSGFKTDIWQFEIEANTVVYAVHMAPTKMDLKRV